MQQGMDKLWGLEYKIVEAIIKNNSIVIILSTRKVMIAHRIKLYEEFFPNIKTDYYNRLYWGYMLPWYSHSWII